MNNLKKGWLKCNKQKPTNFKNPKHITLINKDEFLSKELVNSCFESGKHNLVDKQITGNGFTTAFLETPPELDFQSNIIIAPNLQVILDKKRKYDNEVNPKLRIGFIFGDEDSAQKSDRISFEDFDVLMFVSDSFIMRLDYLKSFEGFIGKILIDESHSVIIGAGYRKKLAKFTEKIIRTFESKSIVSVTATPLLFQKPNIVIENQNILKRDIHITQNAKASLKRLKELLSKGENCIVATQNARLVKSLSTKGILNANFKTGKRFKQSLVELFNLEQNENSNLTIISSSGFEGWDVINGENNIFIFEDRSQEHETFFSANIIQIIGRSRRGTNKIEWVRNTHSKGRTEYPIQKVMDIFFSKRITNEKKITDKNYWFMRYFFDVSKNENISNGMLGIEFDLNKWNLYNEKQRTDNEGLRIYNSFFEDRGFTLKYIDEGSSRITAKGILNSAKEKNILLNENYIREHKIYDNYNLIIAEKESVKEYIKHFETYLRRKYWDKENKFDFYTKREHIACSILFDKDSIIKLEDNILDYYKNKKKQKAKTKFEIQEAEEKYNALRNNISSISMRLVMMFASDRILLPKKVRVWRDYNLLVEVSYGILEMMAKNFEVPIYEVDIRTCNPRILYALNGLELPEDFYGENKKNKRKINVLMNSLSIDKDSKTTISMQISNIKRSLKYYGFHEKVIEYLITNFCEKPKGALFNLCAWHEKRIIGELQRLLIEENNEDSTFIRRHDSVIAFGDFNKQKLMKQNFSYLNVNGWFVA